MRSRSAGQAVCASELRIRRSTTRSWLLRTRVAGNRFTRNSPRGVLTTCPALHCYGPGNARHPEDAPATLQPPYRQFSSPLLSDIACIRRSLPAFPVSFIGERVDPGCVNPAVVEIEQGAHGDRV